MKRMISLVVPLLGGAALLMAGAAPASADVDYYKINGFKTIQSQNNGVNFSAKSGRCNYQAKFTIQTGGAGAPNTPGAYLWIMGKLLPGYPVVNGKPNCQVMVSGHLYDWSSNTFDSTDLTMAPQYGDTSNFDMWIKTKLGDYANYSGRTLQYVELRVTDLGWHDYLNQSVVAKFYDTRMCSPGGSKPKWDCGYYQSGTTNQ
ncbi:hypothetical protein ACFFV7_46815 [Nonomuraea spiralis]|uniref:Uncharacterized protein n=1 Tax=Nonomuraea spiralis TaxID=46182 RepID=A0ABV5IXQ7_9ACTN|nr:hypothetical protein [Nonomuraea spiralis]GGS84881.1 hypothetical protein GCM10010176_030760 [Nonomuraea spiralis]